MYCVDTDCILQCNIIVCLYLLLQLQTQTNAEGSAILILDHTAGELHNKVNKTVLKKIIYLQILSLVCINKFSSNTVLSSLHVFYFEFCRVPVQANYRFDKTDSISS